MTESVPAPEDAAAARAADQARLRKERREAKIKAGGSARLNKITGLGGGAQRDPILETGSTTATPAITLPPTGASAAPTHDDPEEVDISQHYYETRATARPQPPQGDMSEAQLRQLMLGLDRPAQGGPAASGPGGPPGMPPGMENDPMMKMMQQMMGGAGPGGGGGNPFAGTPMENLFNAMPQPGQQPGQPQAGQAEADKSANMWRVIHAVFALGLSLYVAFSTSFTGTKMERDFSAIKSLTPAANVDDLSPDGVVKDASLDQTRAFFFYLFTSVETVLLTTRLLMERNRPPPSGMIYTIAGLLPGQLGNSLKHVLKYAQIVTTLRSDALVCVFVLGVCTWLRS